MNEDTQKAHTGLLFYSVPVLYQAFLMTNLGCHLLDYIRNELNPKPLGTSVKDFLNKAFQRSCPESAPFLWKPTKKRNSGEASSDFSHLTPFLLASTSTLLLWPGFSPASLGFQYRLKPSSSLGILRDSNARLGCGLNSYQIFSLSFVSQPQTTWTVSYFSKPYIYASILSVLFLCLTQHYLHKDMRNMVIPSRAASVSARGPCVKMCPHHAEGQWTYLYEVSFHVQTEDRRQFIPEEQRHRPTTQKDYSITYPSTAYFPIEFPCPSVAKTHGFTYLKQQPLCIHGGLLPRILHPGIVKFFL